MDAEPDPESVARTIALRQLTAAPRTRAQLEQALAKRDVPQAIAEKVLDRFEEVKLVDDAEYARQLVRTRHAGRGLARRALAEQLRRRGVAAELADEALEQIGDDDEREGARALVARRLPATGGLPTDARLRRLAGMLARKGYPPGLSLRVVREALEAEGSAEAGDLHEPDDAPG